MTTIDDAQQLRERLKARRWAQQQQDRVSMRYRCPNGHVTDTEDRLQRMCREPDCKQALFDSFPGDEPGELRWVHGRSEAEDLEAWRNQAPKFSHGDMVVSIIGGPTMMVRCISMGEVHCQWFVDSKLEAEVFGPQCLRKTGTPEHGYRQSGQTGPLTTAPSGVQYGVHPDFAGLDDAVRLRSDEFVCLARSPRRWVHRPDGSRYSTRGSGNAAIDDVCPSDCPGWRMVKAEADRGKSPP